MGVRCGSAIEHAGSERRSHRQDTARRAGCREVKVALWEGSTFSHFQRAVLMLPFVLHALQSLAQPLARFGRTHDAISNGSSPPYQKGGGRRFSHREALDRHWTPFSLAQRTKSRPVVKRFEID